LAFEVVNLSCEGAWAAEVVVVEGLVAEGEGNDVIGFVDDSLGKGPQNRYGR
jgi:hypothetical protein